jgi:lipoate-protein ligase A
MALDEALLNRAAERSAAALRFYQWREPTLSLGYFQRYVDRDAHAASRNCAIVRRTTGGGAILHDRELTYSIALPSTHSLSRRAGDLYGAVHQAIVEALAQLGVEARRLTSVEAANQTAEPFLCFARRSSGDVLIADSKIAGSAQRRHKGAVLQHGSILFERSPFAPELPGICDLADRPVNIEDFLQRLKVVLSDIAGVNIVAAPYSEGIGREATVIEGAKFAQDRWLRLR